MTPDDYSEIASLFESLALKFRQVAADEKAQQYDDLDALQVKEDESFADHVINVAQRIHQQLGEAQAPALRLVAEAHPNGTTVGAVARALGKDHTAAHMLLNGGLIRLELVRRDENANPMRYYLGPRILAFFTEPGEVA